MHALKQRLNNDLMLVLGAQVQCRASCDALARLLVPLVTRCAAQSPPARLVDGIDPYQSFVATLAPVLADVVQVMLDRAPAATFGERLSSPLQLFLTLAWEVMCTCVTTGVQRFSPLLLRELVRVLMPIAAASGGMMPLLTQTMEPGMLAQLMDIRRELDLPTRVRLVRRSENPAPAEPASRERPQTTAPERVAPARVASVKVNTSARAVAPVRSGPPASTDKALAAQTAQLTRDAALAVLPEGERQTWACTLAQDAQRLPATAALSETYLEGGSMGQRMMASSRRRAEELRNLDRALATAFRAADVHHDAESISAMVAQTQLGPAYAALLREVCLPLCFEPSHVSELRVCVCVCVCVGP